MAVGSRGAPGDRGVLGTHDLIELGLHHLAEHAQPNAHAQREQPILRGPGELPQRLLPPQRQTPGTAVLLLHYGLHGGSSRLYGLISHSPRSQRDQTRREDRHLQTSTSYGTTSSAVRAVVVALDVGDELGPELFEGLELHALDQ